MTAAKENYSLQRIITGIAVVLLALKLEAWYLTGSVAILTDALESIANVVSAFIGLYSLYLSGLPKDGNHPYGHGKAEFLSAAVEGALISMAGIAIIFEAVIRLRNPHAISSLGSGIYIVSFAGVVNMVAGTIAIRKGKKNKSLALLASGRHLLSDTYSTIGIVIGLVIMIITKLAWLDSAIALAFAVIIIITGYKIIRSSIAGIMDEADKLLLDEAVAYLNQNRRVNWIDMHNLRIIKYGAILHLDCHLTVPWYLNIAEGHHEVKRLEDIVKEKYGDSVELFVHLDSCEEFSCPVCTKSECTVRRHPFVEKIDWTVENISRNSKHRIN